jgi:hypothetical protein
MLDGLLWFYEYLAPLLIGIIFLGTLWTWLGLGNTQYDIRRLHHKLDTIRETQLQRDHE